MLVLTRLPGEKVLIGDDITIEVLHGGRIGITAPKEILVLRAELANGQKEKAVDEGIVPCNRRRVL